MIEIIKADETHISGISRIYCNSFRHSLKSKFGVKACCAFFREALKTPNYQLFIAGFNGQIAGFCMCHYRNPNGITNRWVYQVMPYILIRSPILLSTIIIKRVNELCFPRKVQNNRSVVYDKTPIENSLYIDLIAVENQFRSKMIGSTIIQTIEEFTLTIGIEMICLSVFEANKKAISFYKHHGFQERSYSANNSSFILFKRISQAKSISISNSIPQNL